MRYFYRNDFYKPKNCIWGLRLKEGVVLNKDEWFRVNNYFNRGKLENEKQEGTAEKSIKSRKPLSGDQQYPAKSAEGKKEIKILEHAKQASENDKNESNNKEKDREEIIKEAFRLIHESKTTTKQILSATTFSAILSERINQLDFNKKLNTNAKENTKEKKRELLNDLENLKKFNAEKLFQKKCIEKKYKESLDSQIEQIKIRKENEKIDKQLRNFEQRRKNKDMQIIIEKEKAEKIHMKTEIKSEINIYLNKEKEIQKQKKKEEMEDSERCNIFKEVRNFLEEKLMEKSKISDSQIKISGLKNFDDVRKKIMKADEKENEKLCEQIIYKNIERQKKLFKLKEKEKEALCQSKARLTKISENLKNLKDKEKLMKEKESKENTKKTRFDCFWNDKEKEKLKKAKANTRKYYQKQREENERKKMLEFEWRKFLPVDCQKENEEVVHFCNYAIERTKEKNRPLFPVLATTKIVKTQCGIVKPAKNIKHLNSRVLMCNYNSKL